MGRRESAKVLRFPAEERILKQQLEGAMKMRDLHDEGRYEEALEVGRSFFYDMIEVGGPFENQELASSLNAIIFDSWLRIAGYGDDENEPEEA